MTGVNLGSKAGVETINFDVKAKLEEKGRKSQTVIIGFSLFLTTKPSIVKFQVEGTATLMGKDEDITKMLEVDTETKVPYVFQAVYQHAFTAMYLLSTILKAPPPPQDLLQSHRKGVPIEDISVDIAPEAAEAVSVQTETGEETTKVEVSGK